MCDDVKQAFKLPARFVIRIGTKSGERAKLKVAIGYDQELLLTETNTPAEFEFTAFHFTALMCLHESSEDITVEEWSDAYGEFKRIGGGSGGPTHKLMFSPSGRLNSLSGSGF